jgi:tetraacyldisaccharide 4'-kinase
MFLQRTDSMAKLIRIIFFFPISLVFGIVLRIRHFLYDIGVFKSRQFSIPVICIGNLELGGSGKTPMLDFLLQKLSKSNNVVCLSRGYGRNTTGFRWVRDCSGPEEAGDEPWLIYSRHGEKVKVAVDADRVSGVERILQEFPETNLILLDDAMQHRAIEPSFRILLTPFQKPFFQNFLFPSGSLRDVKIAAEKADMLVFSKANLANDDSLSDAKNASDLAGWTKKPVFVSTVVYADPKNKDGVFLENGAAVFCISGLASNEAFFEYCGSRWKVSKKISLADHYHYPKDFFQSRRIPEGAVCLCTEKDFYKILSVAPEPDKVFYLPIEIRVHPETKFLAVIEKHIHS